MRQFLIILLIIFSPLLVNAKSWGKDSTEIKTKLAAFAKKYRLKDDIRIKLERSLIEETYKYIDLRQRMEKSKLPNGEMYDYHFTVEDSVQIIDDWSNSGKSDSEIQEMIIEGRNRVIKKIFNPELLKEKMRNDRYYRFQRREILNDPRLGNLLIDYFFPVVYYDKSKLKQKSTSKK